MIPHAAIITLFDIMVIAILLWVADGLGNLGGTVFKSLAVMLRLVAVEVVFAGVAVFLPHSVPYIIVKCTGRTIEIFAVVRFYRKLTNFKP